MIALVKLYFISWWRGFVGPFFAFAFPPLILLMLGQFTPFNLVAPTYILYCAVTLGVQSFSISLVQFKSSSLIKRIGQTPITRKQFILSLFLFNFFLILIASIFIVLVMFLYQHFDLVKTSVSSKFTSIEEGKTITTTLNISTKILWEKVQWFWVFIISLIGSVLSVSLGLLLGTFCSTAEKANGLGLIIYFVFSFLGGIFFPLSMMKRAIPLEYASLGTPMRYLSEALTWAFSGDFEWNKQFEITKSLSGQQITEVFQIGPIYMYFGFSLIFTLLCLIISIRKFKWE